MNLYLQNNFDLVLVATQALFSHGSALSLSHEQHESRLNILGKIMYTCTTWCVRKIQPPNFDNFRECGISPAVFADLWSNHIMPGWMRTSASLYFWRGFIQYVLIFWFVGLFFFFLSPFHFLFKFQGNCWCARTAAVLFLELALSYQTDKHWAFCRKLSFPSFLICCYFP